MGRRNGLALQGALLRVLRRPVRAAPPVLGATGRPLLSGALNALYGPLWRR